MHDVCLECGDDAPDCRCRTRKPLDLTGIDQVIVGGESGGKDARPMHPDWPCEIRDAILSVSIADEPVDTSRLRPSFFFKQWGSWRPARAQDLRDPRLVRLFPDGTCMVYMGPAPTSGGKLLDGAEWDEIPAAHVPTTRLFA
jgi:protein gp37